MPMYEFICEDCGETFEELVMHPSTVNQVTCPYCMSDLVRKLISTFTSKFGSGSIALNGYSTGSSCDTQST